MCVPISHTRHLTPAIFLLSYFCCRDFDSRRRLLTREEESAHGSDSFRAYDSTDDVMDLPADAPGRTHTLLFSGAILLLANSD
jgi:hypothetical protein